MSRKENKHVKAVAKRELSKSVAERPKIGTAGGEDAGSGTTTYSTRFDPQQRDLIERAAKAANCSPAKLIREAAVRRASDIVNADPGSRVRLRELASVLVAQLLNPKVQISRGSPYKELKREDLSLSYADRETVDMATLLPELEGTEDVRPERPGSSELREIESALASAGTEFVKMIIEEWNADRSRRYEPTVCADSLLRFSSAGEGE